MELNEKQQEAFDKVLKNKEKIVIAGYAGTGKTMLLSQVAKKLASEGKKVLVTCLTGKAAQRLRDVFGKKQKNIDIVNFHQVIYKVKITSSGKIICVYQPMWSSAYDAVLVDESSMIDAKTLQDILNGRKPTAFFGDPFQLPPVNEQSSLVESPDVLLNEVYRQEEGSYILEVATDIRNGINNICDLPRVKPFEVFDIADNKDSAVIFLSNKDRVEYNLSYRRHHFDEIDLQVGDTCVSLKNNHVLSIYNGTTFEIKDIKCRFSVGSDQYLKVVGTCEGRDFECVVAEKQFNNPKLVQNVFYNHRESGDFIFADYGYGLTAHKAQGSQYNTVVVHNPVWMSRRDPKYYARWMYTAITRAEKECFLM